MRFSCCFRAGIRWSNASSRIKARVKHSRPLYLKIKISKEHVIGLMQTVRVDGSEDCQPLLESDAAPGNAGNRPPRGRLRSNAHEGIYDPLDPL